ncbi:organic cation transporter protein-like isoform X2 [Varroa jacobsoni]|nr:organic cation transporter protein-like isoform X2 [Varroa destructor]XP_022686324.1 organic cation transporter protein-like isoform X2 [Varroa jacobsoni]
MVVNILRAVPIGWTLTSVDFLAGDIDHTCAPPPEYKSEAWLTEGLLPNDVCSRYYWDSEGINSSIVLPCTKWIYNLSQPSSAVVEWDLVCNRSWMRSLIQSVVFVGQLCGALLFGKLGDRYGRLIMFDVAAVTMCIFGIIGTFAPYIEVFNIVRFAQAMSTAGLQMLSAALYSEVALPADRNYLHLGMTLGLGVTQVLLPSMAKWLDNWRYVQLATGLSAAFLIPFLFFMYESPRWLLAMGKQDEAQRALEGIFRFNGRTIPDMTKTMPILAQKASRNRSSSSIKDLRPYRNLRINIFIMFILWSVSNTTLFGIIYLSTKLGGDRFFNFTAAACAEVPAGFTGLYVIWKFRRRNSLTALMAICSAALITTAILPFELIYARVAMTFVARFCIIIITAVMWVFTMELLPTAVRGFGLSLCFFVGRSSASFAPFLRDLADIYNPAPFLVLALLTALSGPLIRIAPETLGRPLPDTLLEADQIGQRKRTVNDV